MGIFLGTFVGMSTFVPVPASAVPAVLWPGSRGIDFLARNVLKVHVSSLTSTYHCENPSMWDIIHIHAKS